MKLLKSLFLSVNNRKVLQFIGNSLFHYQFLPGLKIQTFPEFMISVASCSAISTLKECQ